MTKTMEERLWPKVARADVGCWDWLASQTTAGYGQFYLDGRPRPAHRVVYELLVGSVPEGLELDHLCANRDCVNPDHLEPVLHVENMRRSWFYTGAAHHQSAKTHCKQGHPYDEENTYVYAESGWRGCRTCVRLATQRKRLTDG